MADNNTVVGSGGAAAPPPVSIPKETIERLLKDIRDMVTYIDFRKRLF